jgi:hypothetical protein
VSIEFPRFRDITEYSTNAIIIPRRSYRHPALRESALAYTVYGISAVLACKDTKMLHNNASMNKKTAKD